MELTVITTISRRIAVVGEYSDICEKINQAETNCTTMPFKYIDVIEYSNAFTAYNDFLCIDFRTQNTVNARILTDMITDISKIII
jgi:hypothetical protein